MTKNEFTDKCYKDALKYENDILTGKIIACEFIKQAITRRHELTKKYYFSKKSVIAVFDFMYYVNLTDGNDVVRMSVMPWQSWIILSIYGLFRDKGFNKRLVREALIYVARKNGKSSLAAILGLYELLKGERNPEIYVVSSTRDQANQIMRYWSQIVKDSPALAKRIDRRQYHMQTNNNGIGLAKAEVNEPDRLNGKNVSLGIVDEAAILPKKDLFQVLQTGTVKRKNPLMIQISTASANRDFYFYNDIEIGKRVLDGEVANDSVFYALYTLDSEDDIENPDNWIKPMPAIDILISKEDMIIAYEKAQLTVSDSIDFNIKHFNIYQDNEMGWIPDADVLTCFKNPDFKDLDKKELKVYLGLDLASTRDLASMVAVFEHPETGKIEVMPEFYFPTSDNQANQIRKTGIDLTGWIQKGHIIEHKNKIIDYDKVFNRIKYYVETFDVQGISYDAWSASILMNELESNLPLDLYAAPQNTSYFNFPLKLIERLVYSEKINLSRNPVLRWHFSNVVLYRDGNDNIKVMKNKSKDSVDGVVSLAMAIGLYAKLNFDSVSMVMDEYSGSGLQMKKVI